MKSDTTLNNEIIKAVGHILKFCIIYIFILSIKEYQKNVLSKEKLI